MEGSTLQAEILRRQTVEKGYQVVMAENGLQALAMICQNRPLILSDIIMPIMDIIRNKSTRHEEGPHAGASKSRAHIGGGGQRRRGGDTPAHSG